jgi:hypothetical protein
MHKNNCDKCNTPMEMYYKQYCPKCDIQSMIYDKDTKNSAIAFFPVKDYGLKFVEGFTQEIADDLWDSICENLPSNDSYLKYQLGNSECDILFRKVLKELNVEHDDKLLLWISW